MEDLKSMTVRYLRALARKHLGRGHSKLKTKAELIEALVQHVPALGKLVSAPERKKRAAASTPAERSSRRPTGAPAPEKRAAARSGPAASTRGVSPGGGAKRVPAAAAPVSASRKRAPPHGDSQERGEADTPAPAGPRADALAERPPPAQEPPEPLAAPAARGGATGAPAQVVKFPPKEKVPRAGGEGRVLEPAPSPAAAPAARSAGPGGGGWPAAAEALRAEPEAHALHPLQREAEPVVEGFFVARVVGEQEARRHHLTEPAAAGGAYPRAPVDFDEKLGELLPAPADDTLVLLPRDPHTLYVFWEFGPPSLARAAAGLDAPRPVLRIYGEEGLVRELEFDLGARSFYVHGLPPGRTYRVEAHFVGREGRSRRIGASTQRAVLPPLGPSPDTTIRFLHVPRGPGEGGPAAVPRRGRTFEREYVTWRRMALPGSAEFSEFAERLREREREEAEGGGPPAGRPRVHLEVPTRAAGASEGAPWASSPSGRGRSGEGR